MDPNSEEKVAIDVVSMEYRALHGDIVHRSSVRFSILPVALGVFAVIGGLAQLVNRIPNTVLVVVAIVYLVISLAAYWNAGSSIGRISNRLVEIEREINRLVGSKKPLLIWEAGEQRRRGLIARLSYGKPRSGQEQQPRPE